MVVAVVAEEAEEAEAEEEEEEEEEEAKVEFGEITTNSSTSRKPSHSCFALCAAAQAS